MYIAKPNYKNPERKIIIFTGAGISAESGISTFRDTNGLWENHEIDKICNEATWKTNHELVHNFYNQRREQLSKVEENKVHKIIKEIKDEYGEECIAITQNVDDLLERAGVEEVLHVHGDLRSLKCEGCGNHWDIEYKEYKIEDGCPKCESKKGVRPDIVFFGGQAPMYTYMYRAFQYLENPESILVVSGTMGNVVQIADEIGVQRPDGKYKKKIKAKTLLNNMEKNEYLPSILFDEEYYEEGSKAWPKIKDWLKKNYRVK